MLCCQAKLKRSIGLSFAAKIGLTRVAVEEGEFMFWLGFLSYKMVMIWFQMKFCVVYIIIYSAMVCAGEEEEEGDSGGRGDQIPRVVAGTNLRRWKHESFLWTLALISS